MVGAKTWRKKGSGIGFIWGAVSKLCLAGFVWLVQRDRKR